VLPRQLTCCPAQFTQPTIPSTGIRRLPIGSTATKRLSNATLLTSRTKTACVRPDENSRQTPRLEKRYACGKAIRVAFVFTRRALGQIWNLALARTGLRFGLRVRRTTSENSLSETLSRSLIAAIHPRQLILFIFSPAFLIRDCFAPKPDFVRQDIGR